MSILNNNIYVDQGMDFFYSFSSNNVSQDSIFYASAKKIYNSNIEIPISVYLETGDIITIHITHYNTNVEPGKYYYDVIEQKNNNIRSKIFSGLLTIIPTMSIDNNESE
jgi:hypothetical protein